jgi:glycerol kinase
MRVLAIDQGTSSTKALVLDGDGTILAEATAPVQPRTGPAGTVEQDAEELLESIIGAGRQAVAAAGGGIGAVGIANQGETVVAYDRATGRPLRPALSWQDRRAVSITDELAAKAERLTAITGLPLDPYFTAPKLAWLTRELGQGVAVTTIDAWINRQLTGNLVTDTATASRTMLLDLASGAWSEEACEIYGLRLTELPTIVDCAGDFGMTAAFGETVPVSGLIVDQQAALFAESCFAPGEAKCTYGTGAFLLATAGGTPITSPAKLASCVAWSLHGSRTYCLDGQVYSAGSALSWLQRLGMIDSAASLDEVGPAIPNEDTPVFVPALAGLGAPLWSPTARGAWLGLSLSSTRQELLRGFIWGLAAQIASLAHAMGSDLGEPIRTLRVDGGLTRSSALMQAQADLLQAPVEVYPSPEATAHGAAALARIGAGLASGPEEAVGGWSPAARFEPTIGPDQAAALLGRFDRAACALATIAADER